MHTFRDDEAAPAAAAAVGDSVAPVCLTGEPDADPEALALALDPTNAGFEIEGVASSLTWDEDTGAPIKTPPPPGEDTDAELDGDCEDADTLGSSDAGAVLLALLLINPELTVAGLEAWVWAASLLITPELDVAGAAD